MKLDASKIGAAADEKIASTFLRSHIVDQNVDSFDSGEVADDIAIDPGNGLEFPWPVFWIMRPCDPGGGVRLPLGGHVQAEGAGRGLVDVEGSGTIAHGDVVSLTHRENVP